MDPGLKRIIVLTRNIRLPEGESKGPGPSPDSSNGTDRTCPASNQQKEYIDVGFEPGGGFDSVPCTDLRETVVEVRAHGVAADTEPPRNLLVPKPLAHQHQQLQFPPCQGACGCSFTDGFHAHGHSVHRGVRTIEKTAHPVEQGRGGIAPVENPAGTYRGLPVCGVFSLSRVEQRDETPAQRRAVPVE